MDTTVKIETDNHDILVLKFNCIIPAETRDRITKEILEEYKTGVVFVPTYMDVYVVKSKSYIDNDSTNLHSQREGQLINGGRYCSWCARLFNELEQKHYNYCPECGTKIIKED